MHVESIKPVVAAKTQTKTPKVSICVVTYNQERYIRQCLQSIVDQQTNFDFEIIVGDDCSSDGTREIVKEFSKKYPDKFTLYLHEKNIGALLNFKFVHEQANGKYIAHMDGDDYALPGKLQAQADILDRDNACNLVWTPVLVETTPGVLHEQNEYFKKHALSRKYRRADLIKYGTIGTNSSKMYRKQAVEEILPRPEFGLIDYFVNVIQVGSGVAYFTGEEPLGVYRAGIGIASSGSATKNLTLQSIEYFSRVFPEFRLECNIASTFRFLSDLSHARPGVMRSLVATLRTFHWLTFLSLPLELKFIKSLTMENRND